MVGNEVWRFANGFIDYALYYAEGEAAWVCAMESGQEDVAAEIQGEYNLAYQQELSGFTLDGFRKAWAEAHLMNQQIISLSVKSADTECGRSRAL